MPDTIQVIRIEDVARVFPVTTELEDGQLWAVLGDAGYSDEVLVGDVIELIGEVRPNTYTEAADLDPPVAHMRRRLITDWEIVRDGGGVMAKDTLQEGKD